VPGAARRAIGFGDRPPIEPKPEPAPGAARRAIGFGDRPPIEPKPEPAGAGGQQLADVPAARQIETGVGPGEGGAARPGAAGGRSQLDVRASGEPPGPGRPRPGPSTGEGPRPLQPETGGRTGTAGPKPAPRSGQPDVVEEPQPAETPDQPPPRPTQTPQPARPARPAVEAEPPKPAEPAKPPEPTRTETPDQPPESKGPEQPAPKEPSPQDKLSDLDKELQSAKSKRDAAVRNEQDLREKIRKAELDELKAQKDGEAATARRDAKAAQSAYDRLQAAKASKADANAELPKAVEDARALEREYSKLVDQKNLAELRANPEARTKMPCFSADTVVWSAAGPKPICDIVPGEMVRAFDVSSRTVALREVRSVSRNETIHFFDIRLDGEVIHATGQHPFWLPDEGCWENANALQAGTHLQHFDGSRRPIEEVVYCDIPATPTYNLSVDGLSNYFVGAGVLVHNGGPADYPFGDDVVYEGTNTVNPKFAGKFYVGRTNDLIGREGAHRAKALTELRRTDLTPKQREFWEFMKDVKLRPRIKGLTTKQAKFFEQKNITIERLDNPDKLMNRKLTEITPEDMEKLELEIANDPAVKGAGFCPK
jgi:hypothetical protein